MDVENLLQKKIYMTKYYFKNNEEVMEAGFWYHRYRKHDHAHLKIIHADTNPIINNNTRMKKDNNNNTHIIHYGNIVARLRAITIANINTKAEENNYNNITNR